MKKITKKLVKDYLRHKLSTSDAWALRCLDVIYDNQTPMEQTTGDCVVDNGIGFTGADAEILTGFKLFQQRGYPLSEKQMAILRKKAPKYWKQVLQLTDRKKLLKCMVKDGWLENKDIFSECLG